MTTKPLSIGLQEWKLYSIAFHDCVHLPYNKTVFRIVEGELKQASDSEILH